MARHGRPLPEITHPADLLPGDGRFGSGPSKVRPEAVEALAKAGADYLGTSHRQATVRFVVGALRNGLAELLALPDGYEILLGNGGTTASGTRPRFGLIDRRSQHLRFGEFSSKFAAVVAAAPFLPHRVGHVSARQRATGWQPPRRSQGRSPSAPPT